MTELKPCPFCGGEADYTDNYNGTGGLKMPKYIHAAYAIDKFQELSDKKMKIAASENNEFYRGMAHGYSRAADMLRMMDAADVQSVKHGRWGKWGYSFHGIEWKRCSLCGKPADISYNAMLDGKIEMETSSICGCCGAKMDVIYEDDKIRAIKVTGWDKED